MAELLELSGEDDSGNSESSGSQCRDCLRAGHVLATVTRSEQ